MNFFKNLELFPPNDKIIWIQKLENEDVDYVLLGSSRLYSGLNCLYIDSLINKKGLNLGTNAASYAENFLLLKKFISQGNNTEIVFLNADIYNFNSRDSYSVPLHFHYFFNFWDDIEVREAVEYYSSTAQFFRWNTFPGLRFIEYNFHYSPIILLKSFFVEPKTKKSKFDLSKGSDIRIGNFSPSLENFNKRNFTINESDQLYLIKIIDFLKKYNIKLRLIRPPKFWMVEKNISNVDEFFNHINIIKKDFDINFIDFQGLNIVYDSSNFRDPTHLNEIGVKKFSSEFAKKAFR